MRIALPKLTVEAGKDPEKTNGKSGGIKNATEEVNSGSGSDKTVMSMSSNSKDASKEVIKENPRKEIEKENEKNSMVSLTDNEGKNKNRNGFNNSFHERVLINNTSLVT